MDDVISRRAALDAIMGQPPEPHYPSWYAAQIEKLPSAQPEIIRCKDCKHYLHDEEYGFDWCNRMSGVFRAKPDGFCSWAERRTDG